jgi:hypothetical protein
MSDSIDLKNTTITIKTVCDECDSTGVVYDPTGIFAHIKRLEDAWEQANPMPAGEHNWYARRADALAVIEADALSDYGFAKLPPEEEPCRECDGSGRRIKDVPLLDVADALIAHARNRAAGGDDLQPFFT